MENKESILKQELDFNTNIEIYWNYYQLHAELRLKVLELFITIETVLLGTFFLSLNTNYVWSCYSAVAVSVISIICLLFDKRTTDLIHEVRVIFRKIEANYMKEPYDEYRLFTAVKNNEKKINYSKIIRGCYYIVAVLGVVLFVCTFLKNFDGVCFCCKK